MLSAAARSEPWPRRSRSIPALIRVLAEHAPDAPETPFFSSPTQVK